MSVSAISNDTLRDLAARFATSYVQNDYGYWHLVDDPLPDARMVQGILTVLCVGDFGKAEVPDVYFMDDFESPGPINNPMFLQTLDYDSHDPRRCTFMPGMEFITSTDATGGGEVIPNVCVYREEKRGYQAALESMNNAGVLALLREPSVDLAAVAQALVSKTNLGRAMGLDAVAMEQALLDCSYAVAQGLGQGNLLVEGGGSGGGEESPVIDLDDGGDGPVVPPLEDKQTLGGGSSGEGTEEGSSGSKKWLLGLGLVAVAAVGVAVWAPWEKTESA